MHLKLGYINPIKNNKQLSLSLVNCNIHTRTLYLLLRYTKCVQKFAFKLDLDLDISAIGQNPNKTKINRLAQKGKVFLLSKSLIKIKLS